MAAEYLLGWIAQNQVYQNSLLQELVNQAGNSATLQQLATQLRNHTNQLQAALKADATDDDSVTLIRFNSHGVLPMSNPTLDALAAQVTATNGVIDSATTFINGVAARIQAAVDAALANGATADQLAPVNDEITALKAKSDALAAAIAANP